MKAISKAEVELVVLGYLIDAHDATATALQIDSTMLQFGDESMTLGDVDAALERCLARGEVERVESPLGWGPTYRITKGGRARLAGGRS